MNLQKSFFILCMIINLQERFQEILLAFDAILGHKSAHSLATGPVIAEPFISPLLLTITPALSSKYIKTPSFLRNGFRCRITTAGITKEKKNNNQFFVQYKVLINTIQILLLIYFSHFPTNTKKILYLSKRKIYKNKYRDHSNFSCNIK